jgi:hypothetical protein
MTMRSTLRHAVQLPATLVVGISELGCTVRNVSLGGVFIIGPTLTIGTHATLRFHAPTLPEIETAVVACWNTDDGTGLRFDGLRALDTYALAKFIRTSSRPTGRLSVDEILNSCKPL